MTVDFSKMTKKDVGKLFDYASLAKDVYKRQMYFFKRNIYSEKCGKH